jgi:iduronate 2-sulfatase
VFCSDHGYHLGDHSFWQKANVHEQVTRVPLIISVPGYQPGRSRSIVELVDLFPTLCDVTALPIPEGLDGKSLTPVLNDHSATVRNGALSFTKDGTSLRTSDWAYMRYNDDSEELYDMNKDPGQFTNLASAAEHSDTLRTLANQLLTRMKPSAKQEN